MENSIAKSGLKALESQRPKLFLAKVFILTMAKISAKIPKENLWHSCRNLSFYFHMAILGNDFWLARVSIVWPRRGSKLQTGLKLTHTCPVIDEHFRKKQKATKWKTFLRIDHKKWITSNLRSNPRSKVPEVWGYPLVLDSRYWGFWWLCQY